MGAIMIGYDCSGPLKDEEFYGKSKRTNDA
jgi:hypothetical protein